MDRSRNLADIWPRVRGARLEAIEDGDRSTTLVLASPRFEEDFGSRTVRVAFLVDVGAVPCEPLEGDTFRTPLAILHETSELFVATRDGGHEDEIVVAARNPRGGVVLWRLLHEDPLPCLATANGAVIPADA